jgi:hypothetical protein
LFRFGLSEPRNPFGKVRKSSGKKVAAPAKSAKKSAKRATKGSTR